MRYNDDDPQLAKALDAYNKQIDENQAALEKQKGRPLTQAEYDYVAFKAHGVVLRAGEFAPSPYLVRPTPGAALQAPVLPKKPEHTLGRKVGGGIGSGITKFLGKWKI